MKKVFCVRNIFILIVLFFSISFIGNLENSYAKKLENVILDYSDKKDQVLFLSDITYSKAQVGWGNIAFDKTQSNTPLTLKMDGTSTVFQKGIWAHATSTVEYDIRQYKDYAYFTTYYGINTTANNAGNGVKFYVYTSEDGKNWTLRTEEEPMAMKVTNNAVYVKIDIRNANYIRLYAYDNGSNASDNAVWADTKLVKEGYSENVMLPVEEFDQFIRSEYKAGTIEKDLVLPLLQRDFIKRVGQYNLRIFLEADPKNRETFEWFIHNEEALRLWTIGGTPDGTYQKALQVLSNLYQTHKQDLEIEDVTENGIKYKDLYLKMMLSLSLSHSANVGLWVGGNQLSDAVVRYEIYKQMHLDKKLGSNAMFENYTIEEMRALMFTNIDDEEILWLHDYSQKRYSALNDRFNPFKYINYTLNYGYGKPQYYSQANYAKWDKKYDLSKYHITYQVGKPKLWIVFEEGAVCGGLSKTAANLYGVWGYPAKVVGQPAHAAYLYLYNAGGGNSAWQLSYSVIETGWANTSVGGRMPNGWGNRYATNGGSIKPASYLFLSQQAQNEYDKYEKSELILLQEDVFKNDRAKLEKIYRDALKEEIINLDAWIGLVDLYITDDTKKETELISLAEEIAEVMTYHPLPMYDLTRRIATKITSPEYRSKLMILQDKTLRKAVKATGANTLYHKEVPVVAQAILGVVDSKIANFSFDGNNAGKIILSKQLQSAQVTWNYSLDGGDTWTQCYDHFVQLSKEQIDSITAEKDIKIHISGLPMTEANIYTIDITKRTFPKGAITINDEEDFMLGTTNEMEWTFDVKAGWNSFANTNPTLSGNKRIYLRVIATGTQIASDPVYYTFTENNSDDTKWYIQSKNLSIEEVNGTWSGNPKNILDGNINTYWRSTSGKMPAYVTIKLNEPRYVSALDYVPDKNAKYLTFIPYGRAQNVKIYVSMDGTNWELAASKNNIGNNDNLKHIDFPEPKKAQYVKFECTGVYAGDYTTLAVSVIKLYENVLVNEIPRAEINYNIVKPTNQDVEASLVNLTRPITVINNDGKTSYTFKENGSFTFEFVDENGNKGTTTAVVNWIDKTPPTVEVTFNTTETTNGEVVATLKFDKNVTILSKDVQIVENPADKSQTITFLDNATYELEFMDAVGNIGTKTIIVDWIDKEEPTAEFEYSTIHITDKPVTVKLQPSESVTILNNQGKDTYTFKENGQFTFEFIDSAGNKGTATAIVSWIKKLPKYEIQYSTKELTNQDVQVTVEIEEGYKIINQENTNLFKFTENGTYHIQYFDKDGNVGVIPIHIDWIDKTPPTAELKYEKIEDKIIVTVINPSEEITFKDGNGVYEFTKNGNYDIIFYDKVGNEGKLTVVIHSIDIDEGDKPSGGNQPSEENKPNGNVSNNTQVPTQLGDSNGTVASNSNISKPVEEMDKDNSSKEPNKGENIPNTNVEYKKYTCDDITVQIPVTDVIDNGILRVEGFELSEALKNKLGKVSECYDIHFVNNRSERLQFHLTGITKIRMNLNKNKKFIGVYELMDDNSMNSVDYVMSGETIEIVSSNGLGRYVISYQELTTLESDEELVKEEKKGNSIIWIVAGITIILLGGVIFIVKRKQK